MERVAQPVLVELRTESAMAKYALCVGVDDYGSAHESLKGAINDANDWADRFDELGFDEATRLVTKATTTKDAISKGITAVLKKAVADDLVVITISGHGIPIADNDITTEGVAAEEIDFRDEAFCPSDFNGSANYLLDDEIFTLLEQRADGVELVFIADCCSSGTITRRLPGPHRKPRHRLRTWLSRWFRRFFPDWGIRTRELPFRNWTPAAHNEARKKAAAGKKMSKALTLSACRGSDDKAVEQWRYGRWNGAYTRAALDVLSQNPANYRDWHELILEKLAERNVTQQPQLEGTTTQKGAPVFG